ncbi:phage integrase family protein [Yimella lutea]|uniref:Phage integrase family protein n=1 Tax=Yimella lutea TaxID=587872 RepID=A0A542EH68_9MICO|nr:tyrosine-type recombinase/integrase [Yimella lutea]TQJ14678.1 phage integrase family protein [Yimella lutea]
MTREHTKPSSCARGLSGLASTYRQVIFANVSTVFTAAVDDSLIQKNPCKAPSVRKPKPEPRTMTPWSSKQVALVRDALPTAINWSRILVPGWACAKARYSVCHPMTSTWTKGEIEIVRQVQLRGGNKQLFGLPKGRKTRRVPLPDSVLDAINEHMTHYLPRKVTLPWDRLDGPERTFALLLTTRERGALNRNYFNTHLWRPALEEAGIEVTRENGTHALRHFYASTLLDAGESIKALSEYLGHADPGFTLRTYTHLMPTSTERTRKAIDSMFSEHDGRRPSETAKEPAERRSPAESVRPAPGSSILPPTRPAPPRPGPSL